MQPEENEAINIQKHQSSHQSHTNSYSILQSSLLLSITLPISILLTTVLLEFSVIPSSANKYYNTPDSSFANLQLDEPFIIPFAFLISLLFKILFQKQIHVLKELSVLMIICCGCCILEMFVANLWAYRFCHFGIAICTPQIFLLFWFEMTKMWKKFSKTSLLTITFVFPFLFGSFISWCYVYQNKNVFFEIPNYQSYPSLYSLMREDASQISSFTLFYYLEYFYLRVRILLCIWCCLGLVWFQYGKIRNPNNESLIRIADILQKISNKKTPNIDQSHNKNYKLSIITIVFWSLLLSIPMLFSSSSSDEFLNKASQFMSEKQKSLNSQSTPKLHSVLDFEVENSMFITNVENKFIFCLLKHTINAEFYEAFDSIYYMKSEVPLLVSKLYENRELTFITISILFTFLYSSLTKSGAKYQSLHLPIAVHISILFILCLIMLQSFGMEFTPLTLTIIIRVLCSGIKCLGWSIFPILIFYVEELGFEGIESPILLILGTCFWGLIVRPIYNCFGLEMGVSFLGCLLWVVACWLFFVYNFEKKSSSVRFDSEEMQRIMSQETTNEES